MLIALRTSGRFIVTTAIAVAASRRGLRARPSIELRADDPHREVLRAAAVGVAEGVLDVRHLMLAGATHHLQRRLAEPQHARGYDVFYGNESTVFVRTGMKRSNRKGLECEWQTYAASRMSQSLIRPRAYDLSIGDRRVRTERALFRQRLSSPSLLRSRHVPADIQLDCWKRDCRYRGHGVVLISSSPPYLLQLALLDEQPDLQAESSARSL